ncbi:GspE/PulE family protein [Ampullimonas aquatilis]|uniref:GspE/PulE family protein n=1 Tax=Ampullimonas aquatilis TaxID=1341549 RepID=UPI003C77481A
MPTPASSLPTFANTTISRATRLNLAQHIGPLELRVLVKWLHEDRLIHREDLEAFYQDAARKKAGVHPLLMVADAKLHYAGRPDKIADIESLTEWLADKVGLPYMYIDPLKVDFTQVADLMSSAYAGRYKILPIAVNSNDVTVATCEPFETQWKPELEKILRKSVRLVVASPTDINRYIAEFYNLAKSMKNALKRNGAQAAPGFEHLIELGATGRPLDANDQSVIYIVDWLWQYAFEQRASDIHVEPRRDAGIVRFRIDGVLHQVYQVPVTVLQAMTARIKFLARMDVVEKRRPLDGRIKVRNPRGEEIEMRLSTLPTAFGEKLVMRIFDPETVIKQFAALGFSSEEEGIWNDLITRPNGIILVTGPTGSGKTTTLYSTLRLLATDQVNVSTIEDPIENVDPALNQMQVNPAIDLGFADGVRALLRQDPDIIMVGEIRDLETAEMAIQAALTGHLVFSTVHTNDAPSAIIRLLELGVPSYLISATLLGVMAQRLVRTLCQHCKAPDAKFSNDTWNSLISPWTFNEKPNAYAPVGCLECRNTGYMGRVGIYELLTVSEELKRHIHEAPNISAIRTQAVRDGLRPLRISGAIKVAEGKTTIEEVLAATPRMEVQLAAEPVTEAAVEPRTPSPAAASATVSAPIQVAATETVLAK